MLIKEKTSQGKVHLLEKNFTKFYQLVRITSEDVTKA